MEKSWKIVSEKGYEPCLHHVRKVVPGKGAERMLCSKIWLICSSLVISSCKWENLASSVLFQGKTYLLLEGSEPSPDAIQGHV